MVPVHHSITQLVVHQFIKHADAPANLQLRPTACQLDEGAVRLMEKLSTYYAERSTKVFGRFEEDEANHSMPRLLRLLVDETEADFVSISHQLMQALKCVADEEGVEEGGAVLIARVMEGDSDCFWIAVIGEAVGAAISSTLDVVECSHLDFSSIRAAGRIDLSAWQRGDERYISFLRGRASSHYFKRFMACSDVMVALQETKKLVMTLGQFADEQRLEPPVRDEMLERAHGYLDALGESGEAVAFETLAREVWPERAMQLNAALTNEDKKLVDGFVPNRRAIRPLVRFSASGDQWKLEFDRSGLRSGAVHYDPKSDTLVLSGVPDYLKRMLLAE